MVHEQFSDSSTVVCAGDQISADVGGEMVILNSQSGTYYGLDAVGSRIWELMREPRKISYIRDIILAEYDVETGQCEQDLLGLIQGLAAAGLVEVSDEQNP